MHTQINYAFNNIKKIHDISLINKIKNSELNKKNNIEINNKINNDSLNNNKSDKKKIDIHDYLYHKINLILSQEIIINESKGIISTKCPLDHITNYTFNDFLFQISCNT